MRAHLIDPMLDICTRCGVTAIDMAEDPSKTDCLMADGVSSIKAAQMRAQMNALVAPILERMGFS